MDHKRVIEEGYDLLDGTFREWITRNPSEVRSWFLSEVLARVSVGSVVLELGCGPGTAAAQLADRRSYTGVDLSKAQLAVARSIAPAGRFLRDDFTQMTFPSSSFDAVVAFYVFNHVPREEQVPTFGRVIGWLKPGGRFMLSLGIGDTDDEIQEDWLGVPMFFASFDRVTNERQLRAAGFDLELSETRTEVEEGEGDVTFQWVIARKPALPLRPSRGLSPGTRTARPGTHR